MSRSSRFQFVFRSSFAFILAGALIFLTNLQTTCGQEPTQRQGKEDEVRSDLPFRVYAQWALDSFDADKDGSLTKEEMLDMQSPLLEEWYDQNKNGKLSFDEIVEAIRRPSSGKVKEQPARQSAPESEEAKRVRYAKGLMNSYDQDNDGFINQDERTKMRRPIDESADSNKDGLFSLNEISASLVVKSPPTNNVKPVMTVKGKVDLEMDATANRLLAASLKKNDKNHDGKLDANEIARARWSTFDWRDSDTNNDGMLTREELKARYLKLVSAMITGSRSPQQSSKSSPMTKKQADELLALWTEMARSARSPVRQANRGGAMSKMPESAMGGLLGGGSGDLLGGLMGSSPNRSSSIKKKASESTFVNVELYLLRLPVNSDSERLANAVKALNESDEATGAAVVSLAKRLGISSYDQLVFSAMTGDATEVQSGSTVPMITGATQTTRGRTFNRSMVEVQLQTKVTPKLTENGIILALTMQKSDLIVTENEDQEVPDSSIVNWTYDSSIKIRPGKPAIIGSSSSRQHWILVVDATRIE